MPNINKVVYGNQTLLDLTNSTLSSADQLAQGVTAYDRGGNLLTGTASGGGSAISVVDTTDSHGGTIRTITGVDISSDTVTAAHLEQGYTAHDAEGNLVTGQLVPGGGGGLEYETGTWTPNSNTDYPTISFTNTHNEPPIIIRMIDSGSAFTPSNSATVSWSYFDVWKAFNGSFPRTSTADGYGIVEVTYISTSGSAGGSRQLLSHNSDETGSGNLYPSYYATSSEFKPYTLGTRYYISGRTYKWIAVWAPTT